MNFLISEFTGLGNFIQKTPLIRCIKATNIKARILLIGDNRWGGLDTVRESELIDEICEIPILLDSEFSNNPTSNKDFDELYRNLNKDRKKMVVDWLTSVKWDYYLQSYSDAVPAAIYSLIKKSSNGKVVRHIKLEEFWDKRYWTWHKFRKKFGDNVVAVPHLRGHHEIDSNLDLLQVCFPYPIERKYDCFVSIEIYNTVLQKWNLKEKKYICLQPGGASGAATPKIWDTGNFAELCVRIFDDFGKTVVLVGDKGDNTNIINTFTWPENVVNTAGKTSLSDLATLLVGAAAIVVHDSGIMHIANALNLPLIALYGPTDFSKTRPLGKFSRVLFSKTEYLGIMFNSTLSEKKLAEQIPHGDAMAGISVEDVYKAVAALLSLEHSSDL